MVRCHLAGDEPIAFMRHLLLLGRRSIMVDPRIIFCGDHFRFDGGCFDVLGRLRLHVQMERDRCHVNRRRNRLIHPLELFFRYDVLFAFGTGNTDSRLFRQRHDLPGSLCLCVFQELAHW